MAVALKANLQSVTPLFQENRTWLPHTAVPAPGGTARSRTWPRAGFLVRSMSYFPRPPDSRSRTWPRARFPLRAMSYFPRSLDPRSRTWSGQGGNSFIFARGLKVLWTIPLTSGQRRGRRGRTCPRRGTPHWATSCRPWSPGAQVDRDPGGGEKLAFPMLFHLFPAMSYLPSPHGNRK